MGGAVGGAETLLLNLAQLARAAGIEVTFLTTCARNHFTWANELPSGPLNHEGLPAIRFPVNEDRDLALFQRVQEALSAGEQLSEADEDAWLRHNVNSRALEDYLRRNVGRFDRIVVGPYLFGLTVAVASIAPGKTLLVPCLHDEVFAGMRRMTQLFASVRGFVFNTVPERDLARRRFAAVVDKPQAVVGFAIEPSDVDARACARRLNVSAPYIVYCGRREPLKGTPLLIDYWATYRRATGRDVKLIVTGSGAVEAPSGMRDSLIDLGFVDEQTKLEAMAGAVAFCHPSVNESLGIVLLEAWLAGTPALVHAGGEVLRDQCRRANGGLWFRDYPEFEECLTLLLEQPALAHALADAGADFARREYAPAAVRQRLLQALDFEKG